MDSNLRERLFWVFWCSTTMLTGILAGFLTSHAIMFGRFQTWFIESGNVDLFHETYTVFRAANSPQTLYDSFFYMALASGIAWTALAFLLRRDRIIAAIAGLSTLWVSIAFFVSGFGMAEDEVMTGVADSGTTQFFMAWNVPIHTYFAVFYAVSLFLLLFVALRYAKVLARGN
ncbi:MAG: hypothetical protein JW846_04840 [Dehalococcoidia bacterium]|nr:hypothetical protein [Dehalococcoidia bacterium]